jgi:hypothetical protein
MLTILNVSSMVRLGWGLCNYSMDYWGLGLGLLTPKEWWAVCKLSICVESLTSGVWCRGCFFPVMWNLGVCFPGNVETLKSKTQFSFPEIHCSGTELLLKFLNFLGPNGK